MSVVDAFVEFRKQIETEQDLREEIRLFVRDVEEKGREILTVLQRVHQPSSDNKEDVDMVKVDSLMVDVQQLYALLASKIEPHEYFKYHDQYRFMNQRMCFVAAFQHYLQTGKLIDRPQTANKLGLSLDRNTGFYMDLEDYLSGILELSRELSRLAVNAVTAGDYARPFAVAALLTDLDAAFRLLNLKNDALRRRFDALKYDVKKVEEVVYDLTIRGLNKH